MTLLTSLCIYYKVSKDLKTQIFKPRNKEIPHSNYWIQSDELIKFINKFEITIDFYIKNLPLSWIINRAEFRDNFLLKN